MINKKFLKRRGEIANGFLETELQTKSDVIKNLLDTQSAVVESLSHSKDQQNQLTSLEKQQVTDQSNKVNNQYQNNQHQKHQKKNKNNLTSKSPSKTINIKITGITIIMKGNTKLVITLANKFRRKIQKQICKRNKFVKNFYVVNLNKDITEEDLSHFFGLKTTVYFR